jgi:hypothetical protein
MKGCYSDSWILNSIFLYFEDLFASGGLNDLFQQRDWA